MVVHTLLKICSQDGTKRYSHKTKSFTGVAKKKDIEDFILTKCSNYKPPFNIKIRDQYDGYVTLDNDYLEEYNPFNHEKKNTNTVQPINSPEKKVKLRVILPDNILYSPIDQQNIMALKQTLKTFSNQNEQTTTIVHAVSTEQSPKYPTIHLSKDPKMGFVNSYNVNDTHRDQYICDQVNVDTGNTTGTLSMIQAKKDSTNKFKSVLPRFSIQHDGITNTTAHVWNLLVFIVLDVYQSGKRTLFYHPQRTFVKKDIVTQQLNPYEIPITTDNWMRDMGEELKLIIVAIEGTKKHSNVSGYIICDLEDINECELSASSSDYSKSRLALVLCKDNYIQWETLVLSNEMIFTKKNIPAVIDNNSNTLTNTVSTSLKRKRPNKRSKQMKITRTNDDSSIINLSANTNNSSAVHNQVINIISQTMSDVPAVDSDLLLGLPEIENLCENSMVIFNILPDGLDWTDLLNMDDNLLMNNDPSLHTTSDLFNS